MSTCIDSRANSSHSADQHEQQKKVKHTESNSNENTNKRRTLKSKRSTIFRYQEPLVYEKKPCSIYQATATTILDKKEQLKKAKKEFKESTEIYYQQLTVGCQKSDCKNKFCTSGKDGIISLQHQAALLLSIQLASMPSTPSRRCIINKEHKQIKDTQHTTSSNKPFLQSLFSSVCFSSIMQRPNTTHQHWAKGFQNLVNYSDKHPSEPDTSYYELDHDPILLSFTPTTLDLQTALDLLQANRMPVETLCSVFQNWEGVGQSFLSNNEIQLDHVKQFYHAILNHHPDLLEPITSSFNMLLDRMLLNVQEISELDDSNDTILFEWCRSLMAVLEWNACCMSQVKQKTIHVLSKITQNKESNLKRLFRNMIASLDRDRLDFLVNDLQHYLTKHFHTGPYKYGFQDTVIMTLKTLELLYQSSQLLSPDKFYNVDLCQRIQLRTEFKVWKQVLVHGEGLTTGKPRRMASDHDEFQFSWFNYPFILTPEYKRKIVLMDAMVEMAAEYEDACVNHTLVDHAQRLLAKDSRLLCGASKATCPFLLLQVRRHSLLEDTVLQLSTHWNDLKKPLKVRFAGEEGVDQGGVQKEFFGVLFETLVQTCVFEQDEQTRLCWVRNVHDRRLYEMVGVMIGLCVYNGVMMNLQFPKVLWKVLVTPSEAMVDRMAQHQLFTLDDLEEGWPVLASGLRQLLTYNGNVEDVFCRDYEISLDVFGQGVTTVPLMEEPVVPVTNKNREAFVRDYCKYFMYTAQKEQILAIRRGLRSVLGSRALQLCTADELEMVACGLRQGPHALELNMKELQKVTEYGDSYSKEHPTIRQFWSVVNMDLSNEQKKQLMLFVTASDRVPVGGLKELTFYIQRNGPDSDRLPTSMTCFSRLLLPEYASREKLKDRLITAIENTKGFGLV